MGDVRSYFFAGLGFLHHLEFTLLFPPSRHLENTHNIKQKKNMMQ